MYTEVIEQIRDRAKSDPKRIIFPEAEDDRVLKAVDYIRQEGIAEPLLFSSRNIDPSQRDQFAYLLYEIRQAKGMTYKKAKELMDDPLFYAAMMLRCGLVDGMVAGASHSTAAVMRAVLYCLELNDKIGVVTSCFLMGVPNCVFGEEGVLLYADCGVIPNPTSDQLARIAVSSAQFFQDVMDVTARVAMLSFSSKGSASGELVDKVRNSVELAKDLKKDFFIEGELQADSALVPEVAAWKLNDSDVAGKANVLIFPTLDAGNIGYKLTERLANARAIGPIILGTIQPCSDLSRGCSVDDIIACTALTVIRAQKKFSNSRNIFINFDKHYAYIGI
ncbi:MAG: phosphate acyltransferase [Candidatus Omnitrophica bacterium]|nr:phosphate acyltransferase [Candidatus Omnitrophota bacterium]